MSEVTLLFEGGVDWSITNTFTLQTNYRVFSVEWDHGSGTNHEIDLTLDGPYIGGLGFGLAGILCLQRQPR